MSFLKKKKKFKKNSIKLKNLKKNNFRLVKKNKYDEANRKNLETSKAELEA